MSDPPPLRGKNNPNSKNPDFSMTSPLSTSGSDYPCKGSHKLLDTDEGKAVATWAAGSSQQFTIEGGAAHGGGSCQASLSYDGGKSFKVIKSYIGNCPTASGGTFPFNVPAKAPARANALFAWTWFNEIGNREMYMNCAVVTITGGPDGDLSSLPDAFTANIGNGCTTAAGADVAFPDPGPDVATTSTSAKPPQGKCAQGPSNSTSPSTAPDKQLGETVPGGVAPPTNLTNPGDGSPPGVDKGLYTPKPEQSSGMRTVTRKASSSGVARPSIGGGGSRMLNSTLPPGFIGVPIGTGIRKASSTPSSNSTQKLGSVGAPGAASSSSTSTQESVDVSRVTVTVVETVTPTSSSSQDPISTSTPRLVTSRKPGFIGVPGAAMSSSRSSSESVQVSVVVVTEMKTVTAPPLPSTTSRGKDKKPS